MQRTKDSSGPLTTSERRALFLELAHSPEGTSTSEVYRHALQRGDNVSEEAYHNIARRLVHRGLLARAQTHRGMRFTAPSHIEEQWLEEGDLASLVDPEYPIEALAIWKEAVRQVNDVPEDLWFELRERLRGESARELYFRAVVSYCEELHAQIGYLSELEAHSTSEIPRLRKEAENTRLLLIQMVKFGLGISEEAVAIPASVEIAVRELRAAAATRTSIGYVRDESKLREELAQGIEDGCFILDAETAASNRPLVVAAVDGSTRGGVLSFLGESGDIPIGYAPMVAINTAIGQLNLSLKQGQRTTPLFLRLPEKPEDMQRQDNRYTVMAKLLYSDLSDAEYMHATWNAMDVIESKTTLRVLGRWYGPSGAEVPPADVVMRDGPVAPQDRDFNHYTQPSSYGEIVRDMIQTSWDIARKSRDDAQTVAGVVKSAQLSVFAPVVNWYASQVAHQGTGQILTWPLQSMNTVPDQVVLTRLLTAKRAKDDPWVRSCMIVRPFHAVTNYAQRYRRSKPPIDVILDRYHQAVSSASDVDENNAFWNTFRPDGDPYLAMLGNVSYGGFFLGAVPRLDIGKSLPRLEVLVVRSTTDDGSRNHWPTARVHSERLLQALRQDGFDVAAEHGMFKSDSRIDVLPTLIIRAHDTVKLWAGELLSHVQEYIGYYLARYVRQKKIRGVRVRPFTRAELQILYEQLRGDREKKAGGFTGPTLLD